MAVAEAQGVILHFLTLEFVSQYKGVARDPAGPAMAKTIFFLGSGSESLMHPVMEVFSNTMSRLWHDSNFIRKVYLSVDDITDQRQTSMQLFLFKK